MQTLVPDSISATPEQAKLSRTFDFNLEALRGFAAILVVWHHVIYHQHRLDPGYSPTGILAFNPPGHISVLVFFVLSGYVIGRVHYQPLTAQAIPLYLKKRFVRIYPIYFVTMAIAVLISWGDYPDTTIVGNLTMVQNVLTPVIFENNPAWSLNYEVLFYLLFIPLSFFRINIPFATLFFVVFGMLKNIRGHYLLGSYSLGFAFWLCGVLIARNFQRSRTPSFALMVSMLLLLLGAERFSTSWILLNKLAGALLTNPQSINEGQIPVVDLAYLPYGVVLVLVFASREFAFRKYIILLLLLLPSFTLYNLFSNFNPAQDKHLILPACFYGLSLLIYFTQKQFDELCKRFIQRLSSTGAWSYGLYMIHFPIITIFYYIGWFSGTGLTFSVRLVCYAALAGAAGYFLDKKFQPWAKELF